MSFSADLVAQPDANEEPSSPQLLAPQLSIVSDTPRTPQRRKVDRKDLRARQRAEKAHNAERPYADRRRTRAQKRAAQMKADELCDRERAEDARRRREARAARRAQRREARAQHRQEIKGQFTRGKKAAFAAILVLVGLAIVYPSARSFYITERNNERLSAELTAIQSRNDTISSQIDILSTNEGVEDAARSELGWVRQGEEAIVATGIEGGNDLTLPASVSTSTISAPNTWYTKVLDKVFFVDTSLPVIVDSYSGDSMGGSATATSAK